MRLQPNMLYADRYLLVQKLGSGGFSEVWLSEDTRGNNIKVALKIFAPGNGLDSNGLKVFADEYSLVFQLNHPSLLKPTYFDTWNDQPYLVLQFMEKGSCTCLTGEFSEAELARFMYQMADALQYLHDQEPPIIHQDIKPDNVLMDQRGNYLLTDFGISTRIRKTLTKSMGNQTMSSGTTAYMAPERFSRRLEDRAPVAENDIFSLGVTMFELLTDALPFGEQGGLVAAGGLEPAELPERFDPVLRELVAACLEKDIRKRPTATELAQAAKSFMELGKWVLPRRLSETADQNITPEAAADGRQKVASSERKTTVIPENKLVEQVESHQTRASGNRFGETKVVAAPAGEGGKGTVIMGQPTEYAIKSGKRKKRIFWIAGSALLLVLVVLGIIFRDALPGFGSKKANYYRHLESDMYGEFYGRYPVKDQDSANVNCYHFKYDEQGRVSGWTYLKGGKPALDPIIEVATVEVQRGEGSARLIFKNLYGKPMPTNKNVYQWEYIYDDQGYPVRENLLDKEGKLMMNSKGIAYYTHEIDKDGLRIKTMNHDLNGDITKDSDSICGYWSTYNKEGIRVEISYLGKDGLPAPFNGGEHFGLQWEYDDFGNIIRETSVDATGKPMLQKDAETAIYDLSYDENGYRISLISKDLDGKVKINKKWGAAMIKSEYDLAGNLVKEQYSGTDGLPIKIQGTEIAMVVFSYDSYGNKTEIRYQDQTAKTVTPPNLTYAFIKKIYDDQRNVIEEQFFGPDEKPALQLDFYTIHRIRYDDAGRKTEESYFGADGNPSASTYTGMSAIKYRYDDQDRMIETRSFDINGVLADSKQGYAIVRYEYTFDGKTTKCTMLDKNEKVVKEYDYR